MKPYLLSLAMGVFVGVIYALFQVRSPAPPIVALVGLLGILVGEQIPPIIKTAFAKHSHIASTTHPTESRVFGATTQSIHKTEPTDHA
jgi:XapX domain-containing protein